jgi:polyisoprenoid-binding protein YceI
MKKRHVLVLVGLILSGVIFWVGYNKYRVVLPIIDTSRSEVGWAGKSVSDTHTGKVKFSKVNLMFQNGRLSGGNFEVDMNSITVEDIKDPQGVKDFIGHISTEDFFEVSKFPTATFKITDVKLTRDQEYLVTGDMTIKGITLPITFPASVTKENHRYRLHANVQVDRTAFGIEYGASGKRGSAKDWFIYNEFLLTVNVLSEK